MKRFKLVVPSFIALIFCMLLIAGSTLALFTSQAEASISATSGKVEVKAVLTDLQLLSADATISSSDYGLAGTIGDAEVLANSELDNYRGTYYFAAQEEHFANGGTATLAQNGGSLVLERMTPGDKVTLKLDSTNYSNVNIQTRLRINATNENDDDNALLSSLVFTINNVSYVGLKSYSSVWSQVLAAAPSADYNLSIELPLLTGNIAQTEDPTHPRTVAFAFVLEAVQGNAKTSGTEQAELAKLNLKKQETVTAEQVAENYASNTPTVVEAKDDATDLTVEASIPASLAYTLANQKENTVELKVENVGLIEDNTELTNKLEFDVKLLVNNNPVSSTTDEVTVRMFVGKDLAISSVTHNEQPINNYTYDSSTGYLTFKTKSFSPFAVEYFKTYTEGNFIYYETNSELGLVGAKDNSLLVGNPLVIKEGVTKVHPNAFNNVQGITCVICPSTLVEIGASAFASNSSNLATGTITNVIFNEGLKKIGNRAFKAQSMTSLALPSTIEEVGGAFYQCSELTGTVVVPAGVKELNQTFAYCTKLTGVVLQEGLLSIGQDALRETAISTLNIPSTVTEIGPQALRQCMNLALITIMSSTAPNFAGNTFTNCYHTVTLLFNNTYACSEFLTQHNMTANQVSSSDIFGTKLIATTDAKTLIFKDKTISFADSISEAVANASAGSNIILCADLNNDSVVNINKSLTIDGNGHTVHMTNKFHVEGSNINSTFKNINLIYDTYLSRDAIEYTVRDNSTIVVENVTISNAFKGLHFNDSRNTSIYLNKVSSSNVYPFNVDGGLLTSFVAENCSFNGWTSFNDDLNEDSEDHFVFNNCHFGMGMGYATLKPYKSSILNNCTFTTDYFEGLNGGIASGTVTPIKVKFNNCSILNNGVLTDLTPETLHTMFNYEITSGSNSGASTIDEQYWYINGVKITLED